MDPDQSDELAVGDLAPDFHLTAGDGHEIALVDYRDKVNLVLFFVRAFE
jgi:peroxiredoxin